MQNSTSPSLVECGLFSSTAIVAQIIAHVTTCVFALSGNVVIIVNFFLKKDQERTLIDGLITNMAVSDLLVPILLIPREIHDTITRSSAWRIEGVMGDILCKVVSYFGDIASMVSIISLCCITIERFVMVVVLGQIRPFQSIRETRNRRLNKILIALSWIIPMVFDGHFFYTFRLVRTSNQTFHCGGPYLPSDDAYYIYNAIFCVVVIIIPFVILLTLNTALVVKLRRMFKSLTTAGHDSAQFLKRLKRQRHIKNLMIAIIVVFGLCWGPYCVIAILYTFYWNLKPPWTCEFFTFRFITIFMARANAAVNPWVYLSFQRKKRVHFRSLIQLFPLRGRSKIVPTTAVG
ncbi:hypothetical protein QZH41_004838 [Actinostola sp. cb2023]|nr:hypothetical protein QZH41_004838 [Actinostola sp. cb2023]